MRTIAALFLVIASLALSGCDKVVQTSRANTFINVFGALKMKCASAAMNGISLGSIFDSDRKKLRQQISDAANEEANKYYQKIDFNDTFSAANMNEYVTRATQMGADVALTMVFDVDVQGSIRTAGNSCSEKLTPILPEIAKAVYGKYISEEELQKLRSQLAR